jgi:hypothetical protein
MGLLCDLCVIAIVSALVVFLHPVNPMNPMHPVNPVHPSGCSTDNVSVLVVFLRDLSHMQTVEQSLNGN